jgi:hypothetical protein
MWEEQKSGHEPPRRMVTFLFLPHQDVVHLIDRYRSRKMACCAHVWICHAILTPFSRRLWRPRPRSNVYLLIYNLTENGKILSIFGLYNKKKNPELNRWIAYFLSTQTFGNLKKSKFYKYHPYHYQKYGTFCSRFSCQRLSPFYMPNIA